MCGIAGVLYRDPSTPVADGLLHAMGTAIAHRGPDAAGIHAAPGVGLVHRRLSIIDLAGSHQPLGNEDNSIQVVFNGEIYNYQHLRKDLIARGHRFRTNGDTEVLVHLYEEYGPEMMSHLRGMFAFAILDERKHELFLARDRVGQKPMFYYQDNEKFVFASELKAVLAHPAVDRGISADAVAAFFTFGFVPGEQCIFENANKLRAAHTLTVSTRQWRSIPKQYWSLKFQPNETNTADAWLEEIDHKLQETVTAHRVADVPVGAFLSGGLDSSAMVACLANVDTQLHTYSVGFNEHEFSELPHAQRVARHFGTIHTEEILEPNAAAGLDDLTRFYDEPFADPSAVPSLAVARMAAAHVKVVISGDGGDEAFGGYSRYVHDLKEARLRRCFPGWLQRNLIAAMANRWPHADWLPRPLRLRSLLKNLSMNASTAYANTLAMYGIDFTTGFLHPEMLARTNYHRVLEQVTLPFQQVTQDPLASMLSADVALMLPDDFLTKVDRASMAYGLEVRPPLVDHEFLELTARIPSHFKIRRGESKWIFKELMSNRLPARIAGRKKQGFEIPLDKWLKGPLRDQVDVYVLSPDSPLHEYIRIDATHQIVNRHRKGIGRYGQLVWAMLVFSRWLNHYATPPSRPERMRNQESFAMA